MQAELFPRYAVAESHFAFSSAAGSKPDEDAATQSILFSKHFAPTYYLVLVAAVAAFSAKRWLARWLAEREPPTKGAFYRQHDYKGVSEQDPSLVESAPLLADRASIKNNHSHLDRIRSHLKSWLIYQPQPMLALTAPTNILPANEVSLAVAVLMIINLFYAFFRNLPHYCGSVEFAVRTGFCCVMNIPVIYVLAAKNNNLLLRMTGWSYEELNIFHRRLAEWMLILALAHVISTLWAWQAIFIPLGLSWAYLFSLPIIILGISSLSCFIILWITSIGHIRKKAYDFFLAIHQVFQLAFLVILFLHHRNTRPYTGAALVVWIIDRLLIRTFLSTKKFVGTLEIAPDRQTVLVHVNIPLSDKRYKCDITSGWLPAQHVFLNIPVMSIKYRFQKHPFTIASPAPPTSAKAGTLWPLQLIIRAKAGFSQALLEFAEFHQHVEVYLDGPYGSSDAINAVRCADRCAFIAGGSGISVTYPLAWARRGYGNSQPLCKRVTYRQGVKHIPRIDVRKTACEGGYYHIWINKDEMHNQWISLFPADDMGKSANGSPEMSSDILQASSLLNRTYSTMQMPGCRPDAGTELLNWVLDIDKDPTAGSATICVIVSGPDQLARDIRNTVSKLVSEGWNIQLIVEKFNW